MSSGTVAGVTAIQLVSAQIGRVTGKGIIANVKDFAPLAGHAVFGSNFSVSTSSEGYCTSFDWLCRE